MLKHSCGQGKQQRKVCCFYDSLGLAKAEYAMGYFSEMGIGVVANLEEARRWYMRSASQGYKRAIQRLQELSQLGKGKPQKHSRKDGDCIIC